MLRFAAIAALLAAPIAPALAQSGYAPTHHEASGAAAGRSPHRAYRQAAPAGTACRATAIHVPGGKLPHYGTHGMADADCGMPAGIAMADTRRTVERD